MKNTKTRLGRSFISALLAFLMIFATFAPTVMAVSSENETGGVGLFGATQANKGTINYVSLGDSMSNGYGLDDVYEHNGYHNYGKTAYPNQFASWLVEAGYADEVKHEQLAMSGMRVEDLFFALDIDYEDEEVKALLDAVGANDNSAREPGWNEEITVNGKTQTVREHFVEKFGIADYYLYEQTATGRFDYYGHCGNSAHTKCYANGTLAAAEEYQNAVINADIITLAIGNGNFGVFLFERALEISGFWTPTIDIAEEYSAQAVIDRCQNSELKQLFQTVYTEVEKLFEQYSGMLGEYGIGGDALEKLKGLFLYVAMSYVESYVALVERIVELNPDVEIILVGNMNTHAGLNSTLNGEPIELGMNELVGAMIEPSNAFLALLPTYLQYMDAETYGDASFYYAAEPAVECVVEVFNEQIYDPNNTTIRRRFVSSIVGDLGGGMVWNLARPLLRGLGYTLVTVSYDDIVAFESALNKANEGDTDGLVAYIGAALSNDDAMDKMVSCVIYLGFEKAVLASSNVDTLDLSALLMLLTDPNGLAAVFTPIINSIQKPEDESDEKAMADYNRGQAAIADVMDVVCEVIGVIAAPIAENTLETTINGMLAAYGVTVDLAITPAMIEAVALGNDDACKNIADYATGEIVKAVAPVYKTGVINGVYDGIDAICDGINSLLGNELVSVDNYYKYLYAQDNEVDKAKFVAKFYADSENYELFTKYLTSVIGAQYATIAMSNDAVKSGLSQAKASAKTIFSGDDVLNNASLAYIENAIGADLNAMLVSQISSELPATVNGYKGTLGMLVAMPEIIGGAAHSDPLLLSMLHMFARNIIGQGVGAHPSAGGHNQLADAVIKSYHEDYRASNRAEEIIKWFVDNYGDMIYAPIFEGVAGEMDFEALSAPIAASKDALNEALSYVSSFEVADDFEATKALLVTEIELAIKTIEKLEAVIAGDELSTLDGLLSTIAFVQENLPEHEKNIKALAEELGVALTPYLEQLDALIVEYTGYAEDFINAAYDYAVEQVEGFKTAYAMVVETVGAYADTIDVKLGAAVRKFMTETPAETIAVLYTYGSSAVVKLVADCAAAAEDLYLVVISAATVIAENGKELYEAIKNSPEFIAVINNIEEIEAKIAELKDKIKTAPISLALGYQQEIDALKAQLTSLYNNAYNAAMYAATEANPVAAEALNTAINAAIEAAVAMAEAAGAYAEWLIPEIKAMAGELLSDLVNNFDEFIDAAAPFALEIAGAAVKALARLIVEYHDDAFRLAYNFAEEQGYVAKVQDAIGEAIAELEALRAQIIPGSRVRAVAASSEQSALEELTEALVAVIDEAIATLYMMGDVIENGDASSFEALAATLNELLDVLGNQIDTITELATEVGVIIDNRLPEIIEEVEQIVRDFLEDVEDRVEDFIEELTKDQYRDIIIAIIDYAFGHVSEVTEKVYNYLINNPEEVIDFIATHGEELINLLIENKETVIEVLVYVYENYGKAALEYVIENSEEILLAFADLVEEYGDEAWELVKLYADTTGLTAKLESGLSEAKAEIEALIPVIESQLEVLRAELEYVAGEAKAAIEAKIAEGEAKLAEVKAALAEIYAEIDRIEAKVNAANEAIAELARELYDAANGAVADLANAVNNAKAALKALMEEVEADVAAKVEALSDKAAALADEMAVKLDALAETVRGYAENAVIEISANVEAALEEIEDAKAALVADVIEATELVKTTVAELLNKINEAYDYAKLAVEYLVWNATNAYYMADEDSYYVAIGDGVSANDPQTMKDTYVDILADALGLDYKNLSKAGLTPDATLALIAENLDVIAKADIITLNYSNSELLPFALGNLEVAAFDWSFLGENANEYVDQILAKVSELMAENGIDLGAMSSKIENLIEAVAYYYAVRVAYYPVVVNEIHKVAPDALVVLVGGYNDLAGCALEIEGTTIALGEYMQYVIDALNLESFVIAALDERAVYVDIDGVETELDGATAIEEMLEYLVGNEPTEAGHDYIAAAILRAINVEICEEGEHVYDNDCDEYCNVCGARRDAKAHVYSSICDENCNVCDAFNKDAAAHTYYNACDAECNVCGKTREVGAHEYTADCDAYCNICGGKRDAAAHAWSEWVVEKEATTVFMGKKVRTCAKCGASEFELIPVIAEEAEEGLSTGAVVAIVTVPSVFGLGLGGFAIYWFAYKKKSFADLKKLIMALFKKA